MTAADRLASAAAKYDGVNGEAEALTTQALERLAWRLRRSGKLCARCHEAKDLGAFTRDSREKDGLARICRACKASINSKTYKRRFSRNAGPLST